MTAFEDTPVIRAPSLSSDKLPHLRRSENGNTNLIVNGKPFLMLAGELGNSALSSARYMSEVWPAMRAQSINTLLGSVAWEDIEPREGHFDFSELDRVLAGAREHNMHLVLLWFGTYKNGISTYAPSWVKRDVKRFPRVQILQAGGVKKTIEMVSPFSEEACAADCRAFSELMRHLAQVDAEHNTVLMVQVENETGLLGDSRDRSHRANAAFEKPVPESLLKHLSTVDTHPTFKARYSNIPSSGDHSCWTRGTFPSSSVEAPRRGDYPSGGPCPHVLDIWRHNTPALDFLAPDLYFHHYESVCKDYTQQGNPLFIPEQRRDANGARRSWLAFATYGALGTGPFGIDTGAEAFGREYKLLAQTQEHLLAAGPADRFGFFFDEEPSPGSTERWTKVIGDFEVIVERCFVFGKQSSGAGMVIHKGKGKFLAVGRGFHVYFKSVRPEATFTGILRAEEKEVTETGELRTLRVFNGDETRSGEFLMMPNDDPDYGGFPIAVTIPARTCIAELEAYWIAEAEEDR
ncbi:glycoside hydrolase [Verticillium alfalfae VaMs.102]|uniref:Glycoside hydrolase n=1 Tax=Verticillium alfalfae (strain VaMs.102 / ATCC MYA-4576 / FGSC 10136) TaxID=526221 RepID=C9SDN3_VERA1|nr:glycoside hydrolase [Verticillium alfalfae VaMs.102]EEY17153.1 glycoside hydrolase [Verticillium alfalfae VaMs.102]